MGMFDWIDYECTCDNCKGKVTGFQTKDSDRLLDLLSPFDVENFYSVCNKCGCWIDIKRDGESFVKTTYSIKGWKKKVLKERKVKIRRKK